MINLRNALMGWGKKWVNPYQTPDNALLAWVDGEWNSAVGVHESNISIPVDLMGNVSFTVSGNLTFSQKCLNFNGSTTATCSHPTILTAISTNSSATVMIGFHQDTFSAYNGMFRCGGLRGLGYYSERSNMVMSGINWRGKTTPNPKGLYYTTNGKHYTFNGSGSTMTTYANGEKISTLSPFAASATITNTIELGIGYNRNAAGRIYYIRFYSRSLTEDEITRFTALDIQRYGAELA